MMTFIPFLSVRVLICSCWAGATADRMTTAVRTDSNLATSFIGFPLFVSALLKKSSCETGAAQRVSKRLNLYATACLRAAPFRARQAQFPEPADAFIPL